MTSRGPVPRQVLLGKVDEWSSDVGIVGNKLSVEVGKAKERPNVLDFFRGGPAGDTIQLYRVHGKLTRFDDHPEVFHFSGGKATFLQFEMEVQFHHALEDVFGAFTMSVFIRREDKEVVHVDDEPSFSNHVSEGVVHKSLEHCGGVGKSKEHYHWFEEAFVCDEGSFPLMAIFDANIVVSPVDVKLGEQFGILELVDKVRDEGEWVGVMGGMFVQISVVLTGAETTVFVFNKEEWGCLGGVRRADLSAVEVFLEEVFSGFPFFGR